MVLLLLKWGCGCVFWGPFSGLHEDASPPEPWVTFAPRFSEDTGIVMQLCAREALSYSDDGKAHVPSFEEGQTTIGVLSKEQYLRHGTRAPGFR